MSEDCIFCSIVAGDVPSRTVHEGEHTFAFLDVNPLARGHTLVIPSDHYETVAEMPDDVREAVFATAGELTPAVEAAVDADATTVGMNNGAASGQEVPHAHLHVVPRFEDDGVGPLHTLDWTRPELDDEEFDAVAGAIRDHAE
ncbi:HIT family protein [Halomarina oriensis]|uniref:HIT domain-containing protein n=1 Tax=Halomarina oriensis TaxID=671145 RepID=A0A6B0GIA6_9EURY|nr:HIT family protein [Halomarina oriensis]MWG34602.1 HIT domain-containing protein [Halomarina oriensis]